jgi:hypothetical protein
LFVERFFLVLPPFGATGTSLMRFTPQPKLLVRDKAARTAFTRVLELSSNAYETGDLFVGTLLTTYPGPRHLAALLLAAYDATARAAWAQLDAKVQMRRERRFAFWGFLIVYAFWIGDLFYERPTFSGWYDWLRLGGVIFFGALTILSYFIMRENWSAGQEKRGYIVFAPIIFVGAVLVSVALHSAFR